MTVIAVAAGLHGLAYIPLVTTNDETDSWSYLASANAIRDGSYSTPLKAGFYFVFPEGWFDITGARLPERTWQSLERQVFRPPGYPLYVSVFGERRVFFGDHLPVLLGQGVLFGLGALLLMLSVRRWWGQGIALVAGLLYAIDPWSKHYVPLVLSETLAGFVVLAGTYVFTRAWQEDRLVQWAALGAVGAALALVRAVFVFVVPLAVVGALLARGTFRTRALRSLVTALSALALLTPWLLWTNHVVGRATMSVWGEGYNLILAASGEGHGRPSAEIEADPDFVARMERVRSDVPPARDLLTDPTAHPRYLSTADEELRGDALDLYVDRLADEPLQVAWEAVYRMWFLWTAHEDWYQPGGLALTAFAALDWLLLGLAVAGSALTLRRGGPARGIVVLLLVYTFVLGTHHVEARFGISMRGLYLALVALALSELARRFSLRRTHQ
jgi:4-amino-4-deoxy-L-arabinose transferase-like glycosyltransferase